MGSDTDYYGITTIEALSIRTTKRGVTDMPSLIKQNSYYYLQFFNSRRQPKQKRVALGTGNRRLAEQLQSRLMAAFLLGEYGRLPWLLRQVVRQNRPV